MSWFTRLTVRGRTVVVGSVLTATLVAAGAAVPIPYVAIGPGVTYDTLGSVDGTKVITFTGDGIPPSVDESPAPGGQLNMTTISITDGVPLFEALGLWTTGRYALAPREDYFPPDKTVEQVQEQDAQAFRDSQSSAEIAALRYLDYPNIVFVGEIQDGSPSSGILQPQDQIVDLDGTPISDFPSLQTALATTTPGQVVSITVLRDGKQVTEKVTLGTNPKGGSSGFLGIGAQERPYAPFDITIALERIGGPSAGLMFALGIMAKTGTQNLTGGKFIAGTGTIDPDGTVGPIGGIQLKMVAARDKGATVFLAPAANCSDVRADTPKGLTVVKVTNLSDAVHSLLALQSGGAVPHC